MDSENMYVFYDEEGNEISFELVADFKLDDTEYALLRPEDSAEDEVAVFRITMENDEEVLELVDDEEEIASVLDAYEELVEEKAAQKTQS